MLTPSLVVLPFIILFNFFIGVNVFCSTNFEESCYRGGPDEAHDEATSIVCSGLRVRRVGRGDCAARSLFRQVDDPDFCIHPNITRCVSLQSGIANSMSDVCYCKKWE